MMFWETYGFNPREYFLFLNSMNFSSPVSGGKLTDTLPDGIELVFIRKHKWDPK